MDGSSFMDSLDSEARDAEKPQQIVQVQVGTQKHHWPALYHNFGTILHFRLKGAFSFFYSLFLIFIKTFKCASGAENMVN